jgi:hypothetical protein
MDMAMPMTTDTRSPWYEAFTPQTIPSAWIAAAPEAAAPAAGPQDQPEADWATEALFDYYNE